MAIRSVEWEARMQMDEAPRELVEPTRKTVFAALQKITEFGSTDDLGRKTAVLKHPQANRIYGLMLIEPRDEDKSGGLFIGGIQFDSSYWPTQPILEFQAPQDPAFVTQENIFLLRGIVPESMDQLAQELSESTLSSSTFEEYSNVRNVVTVLQKK